MITARYGIPVASPGAILREEKRNGTKLGDEADALTSQGKLLPDSVIVGLIDQWLNGKRGEFVFDGFPRSIGQADHLEATLLQQERPLEAVIALDVEVPVLRNRVENRLLCRGCGKPLSIGLHVSNATAPCPSCGGTLERRTDDTQETLSARLSEYAEKTESLIGYYDGRGLLHRIDGARPPEVVFGSIASILEAP